MGKVYRSRLDATKASRLGGKGWSSFKKNAWENCFESIWNIYMKWNRINRTHVFVVVLILDLFWGVANVNLQLLNGFARELTSLQHASGLCIVKQCFFTEGKELVMFRMNHFHVILHIYVYVCAYTYGACIFFLCIYLFVGIYTYIDIFIFMCICMYRWYIYICMFCIQWEAKERDAPLKHSTSMSLTSCQTSDIYPVLLYVLPFPMSFFYLEPIPFNELLILTTQDPHVLSTKLHPVEFLGVRFLAGGFLYPVHVQWSQRGWPLATSWSATTQRKSPTGGALNDALLWFLRDQRWCREGGIWLVKGGWGERWLKCLRRCLSRGEIEGTHLEVYLLGGVFWNTPIGGTRLWKVYVFSRGGEWKGFWGL